VGFLPLTEKKILFMSNNIKIPYGFKVNTVDSNVLIFYTGKIRVRATLDQVQSKIVDPNIRISIKGEYITLSYLVLNHLDAIYYTRLINEFLCDLNHKRIDQKYSWSLDTVSHEDDLPF
jgi:hypothetical protein